MTKYKIKNFYEIDAMTLNEVMDMWIQSREHVQILNINIWYDPRMNRNCAKITYTENIYVG